MKSTIGKFYRATKNSPTKCGGHLSGSHISQLYTSGDCERRHSHGLTPRYTQGPKILTRRIVISSSGNPNTTPYLTTFRAIDIE